MKKSSKNHEEPAAAPPVGDHKAGSDSYQVVARRYRPQTFTELVGQGSISQALSNAMATGRVGHAYLFTGARGVGKTSTARIFAKALDCVHGPTTTPCGVCDICQNVSIGEDIDVLEIDGASNRGIDEIRQLRQNASICPSRARFKIYIIDEVHMLTKEAFNALLKTLEEPPPHVKFIFCTTEPTKIPITILSRCQRFDFAGIDTTAIAERLLHIAAEEGVTADDGVFETLARRAAGSMRDAQSLLEQLLSFAPEHIKLSDVHDMLGTANDQLLFRIVEAMFRSEPATIFKELDDAAASGVDFGILTEQMMGILRDMLVVGAGGDAKLLLFCSPSQFPTVKEYAQTFGQHRILAALQILDQTQDRMRFSTQGRILTELAFVRIAHLDHFQMVAELLDQLKSGHLSVSVAPRPLPSVKPVQRAIDPPSSPPQSAPVAPVVSASPAAAPPPRPVQPPPSKTAPQQQPDASVPLTPQQRLNAASTNSNVDLASLSNVQAEEIWRESVDSIPGALGNFASKILSVTFNKPNVFVVLFESRFVKEICEKESPQLRSVLSQAVGKSVQIQFTQPAVEKSDPAAAANDSRPNQSQLYQEIAENPVVQRIESLFGTELYDVK